MELALFWNVLVFAKLNDWFKVGSGNWTNYFAAMGLANETTPLKCMSVGQVQDIEQVLLSSSI